MPSRRSCSSPPCCLSCLPNGSCANANYPTESRAMILKDRIAVVTGAGSGIGRAGAMIMAREGAVLVIADRDKAAGEATASDIRTAGGRADVVTTDVGEDAAVEQLIAGTLDR